MAVVAVPHRSYGDDIWAAVAIKTDAEASEEELRSHTARLVNRFKVPSRIIFLPELPKNAVGKILKRDLRSRLMEEQSVPGPNSKSKVD